MTRLSLILRSARYHRWSNLAVCAGVCVATAVLTGALMVGDSVRASLRDLVVQRLGPVDAALVAPRFFNQALAQRIAATPDFTNHYAQVHSGILLRGGAAAGDPAVRTAGVQIAALDGDWAAVAPGEAILNGELARSLGDPKPIDRVLFSLPLVGGSPLDATLARRKREDVTSTLAADRNRVEAKPGFVSMFNVSGGQRLPRNAWVNLADLQSAIGQDARANVLLVQAKPNESGVDGLQKLLRSAVTLGDYGLTDSPSGDRSARVINSSDTYFLHPVIDAAERVAEDTGTSLVQVASYLVNTAAVADDPSRAIHYAMIAGLSSLDGQPIGDGEIVLNQWAAVHLHAKVGDSLKLSYYVRQSNGDTREATADQSLRVARILPMTGLGADPTLTPAYKGLTDSDSIGDWRAPEGIAIHKEWVTKDDEAYWKQHKAAPKLFVSLATAHRLWAGPFGDVTSLRVPADKGDAFEAALLKQIDPASMGLSFRPIRQEQLAATSGSTDFAGLFIGFSFFLIAAAVLLVAMLFRLGVEQRARQIGLMAALGFKAKSLRRMALVEGLVVAAVGAAIGTAAAVGYTWLMMLGLRTWWVGAVGTTSMRLHVEPMTLVYGFVGSVIVAGLAILWGAWRVGKTSAARLLAGAWGAPKAKAGRRGWSGIVGWAGVVIGLILLAGGITKKMSQDEAFMSGGAVLLFAVLTLVGSGLRPRRNQRAAAHETVAWLGFRNASRHTARSVVTMGLIALATFALVTVASMRGQAGADVGDKHSGSGGYRLMVQADVPLTGDLGTRQGRDALAVANPEDPLWSKARFVSMRKWSGEDISCLNLMKPGSPTILSVRPAEFDGRFTFARTIAKAGNPWTLLDDTGAAKGGVPVVADDETAEYILHLGLGESLTINDQLGRPQKLTLVATTKGSVFQGALLMGEANFLRLFPSQGGAGVVMVDTSAADAPVVAKLLATELGDYSVTADRTADVLASFANVQNTYLATFQVLGSLGLLLGTIGLAVVLLRGLVERKSELAMLAAIGFRRLDRLRMVLAENALLLVIGLGVGAACAAIAMLPMLVQSARQVHVGSLLLSLSGILVAGFASLVLAVWFGGRRIGPADLRSE